MKKTKSAEERIAFALGQEEAGTPDADILRKMGVSEATFYRCRTKNGGIGGAELRRLRQLEEEDRKLKQTGRRPQLGPEDAPERPGKKTDPGREA